MNLTDKELLKIASEFHILEGEIPCLIRLLQSVREFEENIKLLPSSYKKQQLLKFGSDINYTVTLQIFQHLEELTKVI